MERQRNMFGVFNKEKRELRALMTLAEQTINRMEILLSEEMDSANRSQIEAHLQNRREELASYTRFHKGEGDEFDDLLNPVRTGMAGVASEAMSNELQYFTRSAVTLCEYLAEIKPLPSVNPSLATPASNSDDRQTLRAAGWSDEDIDIMGAKERAAEVRMAQERASRSKPR